VAAGRLQRGLNFPDQTGCAGQMNAAVPWAVRPSASRTVRWSRSLPDALLDSVAEIAVDVAPVAVPRPQVAGAYVS
jgi:hypothetical protein